MGSVVFERAPFRRGCARRGLGVVEVIVVLAIVGLVGLLILASLPRRREDARMVQCRANLMQIGMALVLYQQPAGELPAVPALGPPEREPAPSPLAAMLGALGVDTFRDLGERKKKVAKQPGSGAFEHRVAGFVCPSDPLVSSGHFPAPVSYRATTGDQPGGVTGPFAPRKTVRAAEVEAADGLAYTAGFSERLVGTGNALPDPRNYALAPPPLGPNGCPEPAPESWRGDAGSSWLRAGWTSTLYNNAVGPNAYRSCVASDGQTAFMGASSGHLPGVNVLLLDGHVRTYTAAIDPKIWRGLGNLNDRDSPARGEGRGTGEEARGAGKEEDR